jgi:hypothetical protein
MCNLHTELSVEQLQNAMEGSATTSEYVLIPK